MKLYNVLDQDGNLIVERMTSAEISDALGCSQQNIYKCELEGKKLRNKYRVVAVEEPVEREKEPTSGVKNLILNKWEEATAPFKNVKWVKEYGEGVKDLLHKERA